MRKVQVSDAAVLLSEGAADGRAFVLYDVLGWSVTLRVSLAGPIVNGPEAVEIRPFGDPDGYEMAALTDGVTTGVLRALPLQDARKRLARLKAQADEVRGDSPALPERLGTPVEWAQFASLYASAVASGETSPVTNVARRLGLPRNTASARVRRAREMGLLTRPSSKTLGKLTARAQRLLDEVGEVNG